jgi:protein O-GlcNAc transferase
MTIQAGRLETLLGQINGGRAVDALPELDRLLEQQPAHPAALALRAEALRMAGRLEEATAAYREAGEKGAGARNWLLAGVLLAAERKTDEALKCLKNALAQSPNDAQVLDTLITTLFNSNRQRDALEYARHQLAIGDNPRFLSNAALVLQSVDLYEESTEAFKKIIALASDDPAVIGAALGPARFTCEWEWIELLQRKITVWYDRGEFATPQEFPLTHLTWCADEARNLGVTRAYADRTVPAVARCTPTDARSPGGRIRVGYVSCDFRNHATMHLMAGLFEAHDRDRFEVFAYDYSSSETSEYRQRFLDAVEHHIAIHSLSDRQAAERIAADRLDILFDLKVYTGGCRAGILAHRPAPLQAAYLGFPGSAANDHIDYIVSDRFVTPDSSAPYYTEKFCRLPHTYQCNDRKRFAAAEPGTRAMHGLPADKVVFGAFNQSYKIDRGSFAVWLRVLTEVPQSVLWLMGQSETAIEQLSRRAQLAGIEKGRVIFAPFADPRDHLTRLQLADAVLDTLVCNGHTTTSDALWAGVPVITARGRHFASRVSESLLNAIDLPELVGNDHEEMVRIAKRIGTDADYRAAIRDTVAVNRLASPLFDTVRFTRNFETAIEMMVAQHRRAGVARHIDVPDVGSVAPKRTACTSVVERVVKALGGFRAVVSRNTRPVWVDVECGDGALVMTAADYGFAAVGLDVRPDAASRLQELGFTALASDFMQLKFEVVVDVLSMMDVLEYVPRPRETLRKAAQVLHPGGVLVLSTPDLTSSRRKVVDSNNQHNFTRDRVIALLRESDFEIVDFTVPDPGDARMELYAVRQSV